MLGGFLNITLFSLGIISITFALAFFFQKNGYLYTRIFTILFGCAVFLSCAGHSVLALTADLRYAPILHAIGLIGIDSFLLFELAFLFYDMNVKRIVATIPIAAFAIFEFLDILFHIGKNCFIYISRQFYTSYELKNLFSYIFHYCYIFAIALFLLIFSVRWYKEKTIKREKRFGLHVILANLLILFFDALSIASNMSLIEQSPNFAYCAAITVVFFIWYVQVKKYSSFVPSVQNVSKEVFKMIDIPVLIFDMNGNLDLYNSAADWELKIDGNKKNTLRDLFNLTDVEALRILAKANRAENGRFDTTIKATGKKRAVSFFVKIDYTGEAFCLIMTVNFQIPEELK